MTTYQENINNPPYFINTTPCQFTHSKTKTAIDYIKNLLASSCLPESDNGIHRFTIIVVNNSLLEGRQWSIRLQQNNVIRKVSILSSDKKRAQFDKSGDFLGHCVKVKKPDDLTDVLVVCNHHRRVDDIIEIIEAFDTKRVPLQSIGIVDCKFTVMFDEADNGGNMGHASKFINKSSNFSCIESIHLLTATPDIKSFWKKLKTNCDITSLKNIRSITDSWDLIPPPEELIQAYRKIEDHNIIYVNDDLEPIEYIKKVYNDYIKKDNSSRFLRLFAAPDKYRISHNHIKDFFLDEKDTIVIVINGTEKCIYLSKTKKQDISVFNREHFSNQTKDVEMYATLTKLEQLYKHTHIIITGFKCIERGITFQTNGFNFTDMIIPPIKNISSAVQLIGRANGGKEYVDRHNIYLGHNLHRQIEEVIEYNMELLKANPEEIYETDFRDKTNKERDMVRWCIPEKIILTPNEYTKVTEKEGIRFTPRAREEVSHKLRKHNINIEGYENAIFNAPGAPSNKYPDGNDNAYKKLVLPALAAIEKKEKYCYTLHKKDKLKNIKLYSICFDYKNYQIIIIKYNGDINLD
jgi:hypothetical protein